MVSAKLAAYNLFAATLGYLSKSREHLRILTFHDVDNDVRDVETTGKQKSEDFLSTLQNEGYLTIRAHDLVAGWPSILQERRIVVLIFDDGYANHHVIAAELLARQGMTATSFVITSLVGKTRRRARFSGTDHLFKSSRDLQDLKAGSFEVGSHSHTHPRLEAIPYEQLSKEIQCSKDILKAELGAAISSFANPFGGMGTLSSVLRTVVVASGYSAAFVQD